MEFLQRERLVSAWHMHACMHTCLFLMPALALPWNTPMNLSATLHTLTLPLMKVSIPINSKHWSQPSVIIYGNIFNQFNMQQFLAIVHKWCIPDMMSARRHSAHKQVGWKVYLTVCSEVEGIKATLTVASGFSLQLHWRGQSISLCECVGSTNNCRHRRCKKLPPALCW